MEAESSRALGTPPPKPLEPADLLGPIGTLIGLMLTSFGFIVTSSTLQSKLGTASFQILISIILAVIAFFVITALLTVVASMRRDSKIWSYALWVSTTSWIILVLGISMILLLIGYGPGFLSLSFLSYLKLELTPTQGLTVITAFVSVLSFFFSRRFSQKSAEKKVQSSGIQVNALKESETQTEIDAQDKDVNMALVKVTIEIESALRKIIPKVRSPPINKTSSIRKLVDILSKNQTIRNDEAKVFNVVWDVRNAIVHGQDVPKGAVLDALNMGVGLRDEIRTRFELE